MQLQTFRNKGMVEAGCDEAGRGCIAGPVFAAAVILPVNFNLPSLTDSKKMSVKRREEARSIIEETAIAWSVAMVGNREIDEINILNASIMAMHLALNQLKVEPGFLLIDGNRFKPYPGIPHECIIQGDSLFYPIAAASVLAKTYRDDFMRKIHRKFPCYQWDRNKGYPTRTHREAIAEFGISPYHRKTFRLMDTFSRTATAGGRSSDGSSQYE